MTDEAAEQTPGLRELADAHGIATEYWDWRGRHCQVRTATLVAALAALGVEAATPEAIRAALADHRVARWRRMLPPVVVVREGDTRWVGVHVAHGDLVEVWAELENGEVRRELPQLDRWVDPVEVDGRLVGEATFALPPDLPLGYHRLHARSGPNTASAPLIVTPRRLELPARVEAHAAWGFQLQLYAVRSRRSWGLGDLHDLAELVGWSGRDLGAGFALVNPMHAHAPVGPVDPSPYLPATRRFPDPVYLAVDDVPELTALPLGDRDRVAKLAAELRSAALRPRAGELLDRDAAWSAKKEALELMHRVPRSAEREAAYERFLARDGDGLVRWATWCALAEEYGLPWTTWPYPLRDPGSSEVAAERDRLATRVDFYRWLQWLLDEQLAAVESRAAEAGMPVGVIHDLAVGVRPDAAEVWLAPELFARGVTVGAPPDAFNQLGQDWSQPPWRPDRLAETGYAGYRDLVRGVLRHAGGLRVDHVMGLFRLWWVPAGLGPTEGTYIGYDHDAMVGILTLEAHRAGAVVIGEDLGTVEPWVRDYLAERGVLGTSVLWFERDWDRDEPLPPERWRRSCLATVTTHDLPTTAAYLAGDHVDLRDRLGLLTRAAAEERAAVVAEVAGWRSLLVRSGLLDEAADDEELVGALYRLLTRTPARLIGVALPDAVGDRRMHNQPGTTNEYPNWRFPLADPAGRPVLLEQLMVSPRVWALADVAAGR